MLGPVVVLGCAVSVLAMAVLQAVAAEHPARGQQRDAEATGCMSQTMTGAAAKVELGVVPCVVTIQRPADGTWMRYSIMVETTAPGAQVAARLALDATKPPPGWGPPTVVHEIASAGTSARQAFYVWGYPAGVLTLTRQDLPEGVVEATIRIVPSSAQSVEGREGYAAQVTIPEPDYARMMAYARCSRGGRDETRCLESLRESEWTRGFEFKSQKDRRTADVHALLARWVGRDPAGEFVRNQADPDARRAARRASQSEPIVAFVGLGGVNRIVLLDCQGLRESVISPPGEQRRCDDYAAPSAQTLERADHFWAVYLEDADTPFDTSIDVAFGGDPEDLDFDEFDPRIPPVSPDAKDRRTIKIGWKRFQLREAPLTVELAFSRQGAGYGLRQWRRVYSQRSKSWVLPAAAIFLPVIPPSKRTAALDPVYGGDGLQTIAYEISESVKRRVVFANAAVQWPQLRARADDAGPWRRLAINLIPDPTIGLAEDDMYFFGGSWRIPLVKDRTAFTMGWIRRTELQPASPFAVGQRLAPHATEGVLADRVDWKWVAGLSVEVGKLVF